MNVKSFFETALGFTAPPVVKEYQKQASITKGKLPDKIPQLYKKHSCNG